MWCYKRGFSPDGDEHRAKRRIFSSSESSTRSPVSDCPDSSIELPLTSNGVGQDSTGSSVEDELGRHSSLLNASDDLGQVHDRSLTNSVQNTLKGQELCFGMIVGANLAPLGRVATIIKELSLLSASQTPLRIRVRADAVTLLRPNSQEFGVLDSKIARVLKSLISESPSLQFDVFLDQEQVQRSRETSILPLSITVYGPAASLEKVAFALSNEKIFLQEPTQFHSSSIYYNPHFLSWDDEERTPQLRRPLKDVEAEVQEILNPSRTVTVPPWLRQDGRIRTTLRNHQLAALQFLTVREDEYARDETLSLWQRRWRYDGDIYVHTITNVEQLTKPCEARGGLLADEMGTGKSLILLALIIHTLDEAREQADRSFTTQMQSRIGKFSIATLIVTPKSILCNWESEIEKHILPGMIKVHRYHGIGTLVDAMFLECCDVVLTTYETVSLDHLKGGVLQSMQWFRVVLDEAHQIRNRSTKIFQAVKSLQAQRRWCITGTPVQNRLEDLFALTEFLRFYPVDNYSNTRRYILSPLGRKEKHGLASLQSIMTILALRRAKVACQGWGRSERVELVGLSTEEREKYHFLLSHTKESRFTTARNAFAQVVLRTLIKLRQICSHGTLGLTSDTRNNVRIHGENSSCAHCGDLVDPQAVVDAVPLMWRPRLCYDCSLTWMYNNPSSSIQHSSSDEWICPAKDLSIIEKTADIGVELSDHSYRITVDRDESEVNAIEKSSKLKRILSNLTHLHQTFHGDQFPVKSLVFSCWTTTLVSLGVALAYRGMDFVRIDGSQPLEDRVANMIRFQSEPNLRIMLLSTGCGSEGLNLTAASYVHIVEPQWNPMVEAQAAARVDRLGQTRDVVVIRYIVENSIEQKIQNRQKHKILSAEFSASQMSKDGNTHMPDDFNALEELL